MADHFEDVTKAATTHNVSAWMETTGRISENGAYKLTRTAARGVDVTTVCIFNAIHPTQNSTVVQPSQNSQNAETLKKVFTLSVHTHPRPKKEKPPILYRTRGFIGCGSRI